MNIDWKRIAHIGVTIVSRVLPAVGIVEEVADSFKNMAGKDKENTVLAVVQHQLSSALGSLSPQLLFNERVIAAIRVVIAAIVALNNTIAEEAAALPRA